MSFQTFVTDTLASITARLNAIATNAKKIDELPAQIELNPNSKIHVSLNGNSESVKIAQIIAASTNNGTDQLLSVGQITVIGNVVKIPAGATWIITGVNYSTSALTEIPVPYSATGLTRLDLLIANTSNQIVLQMGTETAGIVVPPSKLVNTVLVSQILVTDSDIGNPEQPITGALYVEKTESQNVYLTGSGVVNILTMTDERTSVVFDGTITKLNSIGYSGSTPKIYNGKKVTLYNKQSTDVLIKHGFSSGGADFNFPDGQDFVLKPKQIISFFLDLSYSPYVHHMYIGSAGVDLNAPNLKFGGYPNTRNDGQITTNRVLGTDSVGNLKMFTIAIAPAPYLEELIPDSYLPSNTGNFILKGSFFTPTMEVIIEGQTVNYIDFISDNQVLANVTTGSAEGSFDVTLNNGISQTFPNALLIVLGEVFTPAPSDWTTLISTPDISETGSMKVSTNDIYQGASWLTIPASEDFRIIGIGGASPFSAIYDPNEGQGNFQLVSTASSGIMFWMMWRCLNPGVFGNLRVKNTYGEDSGDAYGTPAYGDPNGKMGVLERKAGIWKFYVDGTLIKTFTSVINEELFIRLIIINQEMSGIKYVKLAT